ncbi:MAG: hypothetical protein ABIH03_07905 [Pseudomonadota bacterium]
MYASHVAELGRLAVDGTPQRDHWEAAARAGNADAALKLTPPDYPDCVGYLWEWVLELHGRSGVTMAGLAPLTYETVAAWAKLRGVRPTPEEVAALLVLDAELCAGSAPERKKAQEEPKAQRPWPTRKPGVTPVFVKDGN